MTRAEIVEQARCWLRTPYRKCGRDKHGLDCLGLLIMVGRHFNVPHTDTQHYSEWPRTDLLILKKLSQHLVRVPPTQKPKPGMVGVFAELRLPGHVGIFSELHRTTHVIHARITPRQVVEESWPQLTEQVRLVALFDFPGVQ
jgi:cell wall-associated NlpC family hydrolase